MKISIIYFSGTGNTQAIALGYKKALLKAGHHVSISSIETIQKLEAHDLLIIGGPIYAGNMPDELINWVRKNITYTTPNKKAIVYSTSAGLFNAHGVKSIGKKLIKKGYTLIDTPTFEMPRNFYIDKYSPTPKDIQKQQFITASHMILESINKIQSNQTLIIKDSVLMIDLLADTFRLMAKSMGKNFNIDETCIGCGKCEKNCPKHNINYKEKKYNNQCILCTRCIHNCPVNAITYKGKKFSQYQLDHEIEFN
ncbi:MAG: EFR1 family ferrodoxin [Cellulosilyticaceae bacterium]